MIQVSVLKLVELFETHGMAIADSPIDAEQSGRIKYQGTSWPARFYHWDCPRVVSEGESVIVVGRSGITLLVVPENYLSPEELVRLGRRRPWYRLLWGWWSQPKEEAAL